MYIFANRLQKEMKSQSIDANGNECRITVELRRLQERTLPIRPIRSQWWYAPTAVFTLTAANSDFLFFFYISLAENAEYIPSLSLSLISNGPCTWWTTVEWTSKFQGRLNTKKDRRALREIPVFNSFGALRLIALYTGPVRGKPAIMNSSSVMTNRTRTCSSCFQDAGCLIAKLHRPSLSNLSSCALFPRRLFVKGVFSFSSE